ncbi:helix-turn-helix domain-containing protein [Streptomyces sp. CAU 1734]|uniref:TetR/AcrR family transcriptional regulator n=1 Tax=Streptomyces sp. CAU 1734 TaxID=3140360 RepID=UPI0032619A62
MALPRFQRLPADAKAAILAVARAHFARDGKDGASFNRIITDAGISKTSAYHYFDGKDDLFGEVVADAAERALAALGPWTEAATEDELWERAGAGSDRLRAHLRAHPDDRAVLSARPREQPGGHPWIRDFIENGRRLGLIGDEPGIELVTVATTGVLEALDSWALERPEADGDLTAGALRQLLSRLWK